MLIRLVALYSENSGIKTPGNSRLDEGKIGALCKSIWVKDLCFFFLEDWNDWIEWNTLPTEDEKTLFKKKPFVIHIKRCGSYEKCFI